MDSKIERNLGRPSLGDLRCRQDLGQRVPFDQLHREIRATVAEGSQLVDGDDSRMLQLAGDLGFFDEPADHLGLLAMRFEQDFHGEVTAEVGVAAFEHRPHAASRDLAEEMQASRAFGGVGNLGGRRADHRVGVGRRVGIAKEHRRDLAERLAEPREDAGRGWSEGDGELGHERPFAENPGLQQASRAKARRSVERPDVATAFAAVLVVHRRALPVGAVRSAGQPPLYLV